MKIFTSMLIVLMFGVSTAYADGSAGSVTELNTQIQTQLQTLQQQMHQEVLDLKASTDKNMKDFTSKEDADNAATAKQIADLNKTLQDQIEKANALQDAQLKKVQEDLQKSIESLKNDVQTQLQAIKK